MVSWEKKALSTFNKSFCKVDVFASGYNANGNFFSLKMSSDNSSIERADGNKNN